MKNSQEIASQEADQPWTLDENETPANMDTDKSGPTDKEEFEELNEEDASQQPGVKEEEPADPAPETTDATISEDIRVVISKIGDITLVGVKTPLTDPYTVSFQSASLEEVAEQLTGIVEQAASHWEKYPTNPKYVNPEKKKRTRGHTNAGQAGTITATRSQPADRTQPAPRPPKDPKMPRLFDI